MLFHLIRNCLATRRRIGVEAAWVAITQLLMVICYAAGFRLITENYKPELLGEATLLTGVVTFVAALVLNPIWSAHVRLFPEYLAQGLALEFHGHIVRYLVRVLAIISLLGFGAAVVSGALNGWHSLLIATILLATLFGQSSFTLDTNVHSAQRRQDRLALLRVLRIVAYPLLAVGLVTVFPASLYLLLAAGAASYWIPRAISSAFGWSRELRNGDADRTLDTSALAREAASFGAPFVVLAIANWLSAVGDRYILAMHMGVSEVGVYAAVYGLFTQPYFMLAGGLGQWLRPILFEAVAQGEGRRAHKLMQRWIAAAVCFGLVGGLILWFGREMWLSMLLSQDYRHEGMLILYILIGYTAHVVSSALSYHLMAVKQTRALLMPLLVTSAANILLNLYLIPTMGLDGAGLATAVSFSLHATILALIVRRYPLHKRDAGVAST